MVLGAQGYDMYLQIQKQIKQMYVVVVFQVPGTVLLQLAVVQRCVAGTVLGQTL